MSVTVLRKSAKVPLLDAYYAEKPERNIISYGPLEAMGYGICYRAHHRMISAVHGGPASFYVETSYNVVVVCAVGFERANSVGNVLMSVVARTRHSCFMMCRKEH